MTKKKKKIASDMFSKGMSEKEISQKVSTATGLKEMFDMLTFLAKESLVNPTYKELEEAVQG